MHIHPDKRTFFLHEDNIEDGEHISGTLHCHYLNGTWHREDGPAVLWEDGNQFWYLNGKRINCSSQEEFEQYMRLKAFW